MLDALEKAKEKIVAGRHALETMFRVATSRIKKGRVERGFEQYPEYAKQFLDSLVKLDRRAAEIEAEIKRHEIEARNQRIANINRNV